MTSFTYRDFCIYEYFNILMKHTGYRAYLLDNNPNALYSYLTTKGTLKKFLYNDSLVVFHSLEELEDALSIYYSEQVNLDIPRTRKVLYDL